MHLLMHNGLISPCLWGRCIMRLGSQTHLVIKISRATASHASILASLRDDFEHMPVCNCLSHLSSFDFFWTKNQKLSPDPVNNWAVWSLWCTHKPLITDYRGNLTADETEGANVSISQRCVSARSRLVFLWSYKTNVHKSGTQFCSDISLMMCVMVPQLLCPNVSVICASSV